MKQGMVITWMTLRLLFCDWKFLLFLCVGTAGACIIDGAGFYTVLPLGFVYYAWILAWRRSLARFVIQESQGSPSLLSEAVTRGIVSLGRAWTLSSWYVVLFVIEYIIFLTHLNYALDIGLVLSFFALALNICQFLLDFFWIPLAVDGVTNLSDIMKFTTLYAKKNWFLLFQTFFYATLVGGIFVYGIAFGSFLIGLPPLIFQNTAYCCFYWFLTSAQAIFYLRVHYLVERS